MADWVRVLTGTAPSGTNADVAGRVSLDNSTAPVGFDPGAVTNVQFEWTLAVTGGTFVDDDWDPDEFVGLAFGASVPAAATHGAMGAIDSGNTSEAGDVSDTSPDNGFTVANWEACEFFGFSATGGNSRFAVFNQNMMADAVTVAITAVTVTITYTPDTTQRVAVGVLATTDNPLPAAPRKVAPIGVLATTDILLGSVVAVPGYVLLDGTDDMTTPDDPKFELTGDGLEVIWQMAPDDWTPASITFPVGKYTAVGDDRSWRTALNITGTLGYTWSEDGIATTTVASTSALAGTAGISDGDPCWLRVTHDFDDGAGGNDVTFYYSLDPITTPRASVSWTPLGLAITGGVTTSIFDGDAVVRLGQSFAGKIYGAWFLDDIAGTEVGNPDFRDNTTQGDWSSPPADDGHSNTWTFNNDAVWVANIAGSTLPRKVAPIGTLVATDLLVAVEPPAGGQTIAVGVLAADDALLPIAAVKPIITPVGVLALDDILLGVQARKVAPIGTQATDDVLVPVQARKVAPIGTMTLTDLLLPAPPLQPIVQAVGTLALLDNLLAIQATKQAAVGTLAATDLLVAIQAAKRATVGTMALLDLLVAVQAVKPIITPVGTLAGTDLLVAIEVLQALRVDVGTLATTDLLVAVQAIKRIVTAVGVLATQDLLLAVTAVHVAGVGTMATTDSLLAVQARKVAQLGTLATTDLLVPIAVQQVSTAVGVLATTDLLLAIAARKLVDVGTLALLDQLVAIAAAKVAPVGTLPTSDLLLPVQARKLAPVGTLAGLDLLVPVQPRRLVTVGALATQDLLVPVAVQQAISVVVGVLTATDLLVPIGVVQVGLKWWTKRPIGATRDPVGATRDPVAATKVPRDAPTPW